jgi:hypothetical protein
MEWHSANAHSLSSIHCTDRQRSPHGPLYQCLCRAFRRHSVKLASLPSAKVLALGKEALPVPGVPSLPSAMTLTLDKVTRLPLFYLFFVFHPNKQKIYHIIITYTSHISHNYHIHNRDHIFCKKTQNSQVFRKHVYAHTKIHQHKYHTTLKHKFFTNISTGQVYHTS